MVVKRGATETKNEKKREKIGGGPDKRKSPKGEEEGEGNDDERGGERGLREARMGFRPEGLAESLEADVAEGVADLKNGSGDGGEPPYLEEGRAGEDEKRADTERLGEAMG